MSVLSLLVLSIAAATPVPERIAPGVIARPGSHESFGPLAPDGRWRYFTRADARFERSTLWRCRPVAATGCRDAEPVRLGSTAYDAGLSFAPGGRYAVFTSRRPTGRSDATDEWNLWRVEHRAGEFGAPVPLSAPLNSDASECCAVFDARGDLWFASERAGTWDVYRARATPGGFAVPERLPEPLNSPGMEWPAWVDASRGLVLFSSIRAGGVGGDDLYLAREQADAWRVQAFPVPINTAGYEDAPSLSEDGQRLRWSSRAPGPASDSDPFELRFDLDSLR